MKRREFIAGLGNSAEHSRPRRRGDRIKRREFIAGLGGAAAWPLVARAQQGERTRRVVVLMPFRNDYPDAQTEMAVLRRGLAERGWIEGRTIDVAVRWGDSPIEASAKELVGAAGIQVDADDGRPR